MAHKGSFSPLSSSEPVDCDDFDSRSRCWKGKGHKAHLDDDHELISYSISCTEGVALLHSLGLNS